MEMGTLVTAGSAAGPAPDYNYLILEMQTGVPAGSAAGDAGL